MISKKGELSRDLITVLQIIIIIIAAVLILKALGWV